MNTETILKGKVYVGLNSTVTLILAEGQGLPTYKVKTRRFTKVSFYYSSSLPLAEAYYQNEISEFDQVNKLKFSL